jgi:hypothetical protein
MFCTEAMLSLRLTVERYMKQPSLLKWLLLVHLKIAHLFKAESMVR